METKADGKRRARRALVALALALDLLAVMVETAAAEAAGFTPYDDPGIDEPWAVTADPDGGAWFTSRDNARIGHLTAEGDITTFEVGLVGVDFPDSIATAADGDVWFASAFSGLIGRLTPGGEVTSFHDPAIGSPAGVVIGPDGALWFTDLEGHIGRLSSTGEVTTYTDSDLDEPSGITLGPDGNLWFTDEGSDRIGRITPSGTITTFTDAAVGGPQGITVGHDGNLWFASTEANAIGRITPAGAIATYQHPDLLLPTAVVAGPHGAVWATSGLDDAVARVQSDGSIQVYDAPEGSFPVGIAAGAENRLWIAAAEQDRILRFEPQIFTQHGGAMGPSYGLTVGPDDNVWYTALDDPNDPTGNPGHVGRMLPDLTAERFPIGVEMGTRGAWGIVDGPLGSVWFVNSLTDSVGRLTPAGQLHWYEPPEAEFPTDEMLEGPKQITVGPDGNLWITNTGKFITRMTPDGSFSRFDIDELPGGELGADRIVAGPDGALWFGLAAGGIGRITVTGTTSTFTPEGVDTVTDLVVGPDGEVWVASSGVHNVIGQLSMDGTVTTYDDHRLVQPYRLVPGPDGNLWFTHFVPSFMTEGRSGLGRMTLDGDFSFYEPDPATGIRVLTELVAAPDGSIWFSAGLGGADHGIFRFVPPASTGGPVATIPMAPTGLVATPGDGQVSLSWDAPADDGGSPITSYRVYRNGQVVHETASGSIRSYVDTGLTNGTQYSYEVVSVNAVGEGFSTLPVQVTPSATTAPAFGDVGSSHPFFADIQWMNQQGISTGFEDGSYRPSLAVSRQAMSAFMFRLAGSPEFTVPAVATFADVGTGHPFFEAIEWMAFAEITTGYPGTPKPTYRPGAPVTRQAMSAFMFRLAGSPEFTVPAVATFADVGTGHPFFEAIEWMAFAEITTGYPGTPKPTYRPDVAVSRQAMSAFMRRLAEGPGVGI